MPRCAAATPLASDLPVCAANRWRAASGRQGSLKQKEPHRGGRRKGIDYSRLEGGEGNRTKAAEKIGMSRRTLHCKLHTYNLHDL